MSALLCYPTFNKCFVLETDASQQGLGAILSQDSKLHPVAYTSWALAHAEKRYPITDLHSVNGYTFSCIFVS